ncbi:MAG: hypothetical protein CME26_10105 [Gemmatimonadetes bacterium]|nr:hypothetical protein [Gemmatimonadota bacterium]|tara:strand:+ start:2931 stop:3515 length:585 start_codon:yes stop_codon:yes gene_type:complete
MIFITDSRSSLSMRDFAVTVIISVIASLLVTLTLIPLAASRAFTDRGRHVDIALKALISIVAVGGISHTIYHTGTAQSFAWITDNIAWLLGGFSTLPPTTWAAVLLALSIPVFLDYRFRKVGCREAYATVIGSTLNYRWSTVADACVLLAFGFHIYGKIEKSPYRWQGHKTRHIHCRAPPELQRGPGQDAVQAV